MDKRLKGMLNATQVARKLGISRQQVSAYMNEGRIKYQWIGTARYVHADDVKKPKPKRAAYED